MVMDTTSEVMVIMPDRMADTRSRAVAASPPKSHQYLSALSPGNSRGEKTIAYARPSMAAHIAAGISQRLACMRVRGFMKCCITGLLNCLQIRRQHVRRDFLACSKPVHRLFRQRLISVPIQGGIPRTGEKLL